MILSKSVIIAQTQMLLLCQTPLTDIPKHQIIYTFCQILEKIRQNLFFVPYLKNMKMVITSFCRGKAV